MKGFKKEDKDERMDAEGCSEFVKSHFEDVAQILSKLESVNLTLSVEKSNFRVSEILVLEQP